MSQNLKQNALGRKMLHRFCRCLMGLCMALALWNSSLFIPLAQADVFTGNFAIGRQMEEDEDGNMKEVDTIAFKPEEKDAIDRSLEYVNGVVTTARDGERTIRFLKHGYEKVTEPSHSGFKKKTNLAHANYTGSLHVCFNQTKTWLSDECSQIIENASQSMQTIAIHEMAHSLGMSLNRNSPTDPAPSENDDNDKIIHANNLWSTGIIEIAPNGVINDKPFKGEGLPTSRGTDNLNTRLADGYRYYFRGDEAIKVYGDYWATNSTAFVPVDDGLGKVDNYKYKNGTTLTHCYTRFGVLNGISSGEQRPFYNEVELAVLQDLDNTVNIRQQFGRSLYQGNNTVVSVTNTRNYGANWNDAAQTYDNAPNDALYGIGLHIVGDRYNVTQAANLLADGKYGTGIRVEGTGNTVTINPGVRVTGNGEGGIGVLATHGTENILNNRGTIEATGKEGTAVYLNYGSWSESENDYKYSVSGGLLAFDNTGTINAGNKNNAIYVHRCYGEEDEEDDDEEEEEEEEDDDEHDYQELTINIMGGSIIGNITSQPVENEDDQLVTLTFGKQADADGMSTETGNADFDMTYAGDINGNDAINLEHWGGNLTLTGSVYVERLSVGNKKAAANSTLNAPGSIIADDYVYLGNSDTNKTVIYDGKSTGSLNCYSLNNYENSTIKNVVSITSDNEIGYFYNKGTVQNVKSIQIKNFNNNGKITVGEAGAIDTMNVKGSMQHNNGTLNIDANLQAAPVSGTTADLINVQSYDWSVYDMDEEEWNDFHADGKLTINGGQVNVNELNSTGSSYYRADINHNIIETEDGVVVNSELTAKETGFDIPLFKPVVGYDDKNVWLSLQRDFLYGPAAQTGNQEAIGYYIDEIGKTPNPAGDLFPVLIQLDSLNGDKEAGIVSPRALHALEEMSGAVYGTLTSLANQHATMVNNSLAKHLRCWSPCDVMVNNWNLWGEGYGMGGNAVSDGNANGYNYTVGGMLIGIDRQIAIEGHFGFYFAVGSTNANVKGLSESADSTDIFAGLYFNYKDTIGWYTTVLAGFGYSDYDVERNFSFIPRSNKSSFNSRQFSAYVERGKNFSISDSWVFQPFGGLQFISSDRGAIQEKGADLLDLTVSGASMSSLRSLLGIKLATVNCVTGRKLNGEFNAAWMHEFLDTSSAVSAHMSNPGGAYFESSPTFIVRGHNDGRDWFVTGVGLNYAFTDYFKLFGGYDCMVNGVGAMHRGNLGLEIKR